MVVASPGAHRARATAVVFGSSLSSGLAIVSFSASGRYLIDELGLDSEAYGRIFLPQLTFAVLGGLLGGGITERLGAKATLGLVLLCESLAMAALYVAGWNHHYALLLVATALYGFSFGVAGGPWSVYPPSLFPKAKSSAIASVYTVFGLGLTVGPLLVHVATSHGRWPVAPLGICAGAACGLLLLAVTKMPDASADAAMHAVERPSLDRVVVGLFLAASFFYATIEASIANWAVTFLTGEQRLSSENASVALATFFGAFTGGRLMTSIVIRKVAPLRLWALLPGAMLFSLLALPLATTPERAVLIYGVAGLACSGHFPLSMALSSEYVGASASARVSSWMFAALMAGVGLGAYFVGLMHAYASMARAYQLLIISPVILLGVAIVLRGRSQATEGTSHV